MKSITDIQIGSLFENLCSLSATRKPITDIEQLTSMIASWLHCKNVSIILSERVGSFSDSSSVFTLYPNRLDIKCEDFGTSEQCWFTGRVQSNSAPTPEVIDANTSIERGIYCKRKKTPCLFCQSESSATIAVYVFSSDGPPTGSLVLDFGQSDLPLTPSLPQFIAFLSGMNRQLEARLKFLKREDERDILLGAFNNFPDAMVLVNSDREIIVSNPALTKTFGYQESEVVGKTTEVFYTSRDEFLRQGELRYNLSADEKSKPFRIEYAKANGEVFPSETVGTIIKDSDGDIIGNQGLMRDITASVEKEQELVHQKNLFEAIFRNSSNIIILSDTEQTITHANDTALRILGYSHDELIGQKTDMLFYNIGSFIDEKNLLPQNIASPIERPFVTETFDCVTKSRDKLPVELSIGFLPLDNKDASCFVYVGRDVSKQIKHESNMKRINDRLERLVTRRTKELDREKLKAEHANTAKSKFLANMSHEIRTPMNGVIGTLQLLAEEEIPSDQREYLDLALESSRSLLTLVNDILDLSKIEAGSMEMLEEAFSVSWLVETISQLFEYECKKKGILLTVNIHYDGDLSVLTDRAILRQVLLNLVGNAVKFTEKGSVSLDVSLLNQRTGYSLEVTIQDTGVGIPSEHINHIFEPFTQIDGSYKRRHQGTGLGLSIVKKLLEMLGGEINIASSAVWGTEVRCTIPVKESKSLIYSADKPVEPICLGKILPKHILVAEDNIINQITLRKILEKQGHTVSLAQNGQEVIDMLKDIHDIIFMDIQMPVMDGLEATQYIRKMESSYRKNVPIVALTAHAYPEDKQKAFEAGISYYLTKPLNINEIRKTMSQIFKEK